MKERKNNSENLKVAIVTEHLWKMGGANRVLNCFCEMFPTADIYCLFGEKNFLKRKEVLSDEICKHRVFYSKLNNLPFVRKYYQYTFRKWIKNVEKFNLSNYDLVISSSSSVAHGVITPYNCLHISYIHSPMRFIWDLNKTYFGEKRGSHSLPVGLASRIPFNFARIWDVCASNRSEVLIANSNCVRNRISKYWKKESKVIYPPVEMYKGKLKERRDDYFVCGAPFEKNKGGEFLLEKAKNMGFNLKVIGTGSMLSSMKRKYGKCDNIEILGWVSEDEKWNMLCSCSGYIVAGEEDYGIFPVEALSCGTPVLAFKGGGSLETVVEGKGGMFFEWNNFEDVFEKFRQKDWDCRDVRMSLRNFNTKDSFKEKIMDVLVDNGIHI
ncbi:MAG TPA: glycosyltransferase [Candidatus Dojkabacteria bacterium]|nr:glycosyltransferase [Candidatus Dojkabacteria bacterium]